MRKFWVAAVAGVVLIAGGCKSRGIESKASVEAAIVKHLQQRPNIVLNNMNLEVQDVKFEGERARAEVKFSNKNQPDLAVGVRYVLRRAGDHWEVESSSPTGGMGANPHGGAQTGAPSSEPSTPPLQPSH